jgi:hypothetical protein
VSDHRSFANYKSAKRLALLLLRRLLSLLLCCFLSFLGCHFFSPSADFSRNNYFAMIRRSIGVAVYKSCVISRSNSFESSKIRVKNVESVINC